MMRRPPLITHHSSLCALAILLALLPAPSRAAVISRATEISMGREAAQEYERTAAVDVDPVLTARVRRIGSRLIAAAEAPPYPFEFHEVETNGINAFALPGGFIYVFRGLAQLEPGDDALAFILAHESTHAIQRHGIKQLEKSTTVGVALTRVLGWGWTSSLLRLALDMHYSRHDEAEADRLGLELMAKAGYDPTQAAEAMAVIARAAKSEKYIPALLRSHPLTQDRIASLRRQAAALRAVPRPRVETANLPPLPPPDRVSPPPASIARSQLYPLSVGMSWTYRATGSDKRPALTTTVLEETPECPGIFRVRVELDEGVATTHLLAVTPDGVCVRRETTARAVPFPGLRVAHTRSSEGKSPPPAAWQTEIPLPANPTPEDASEAWEQVSVPAGEYRALRVVQRAAGAETATVWLAPGVGMVRRAWNQSGMVEELESFRRPTPDAQRSKDAEKQPAAPPVNLAYTKP